MEKNIIEISEDSLLDILKQKKFKFTLEEINQIISQKLKGDILHMIWLDPEDLESNERVKKFEQLLFSFKMFLGNFNVFEFGSHFYF